MSETCCTILLNWNACRDTLECLHSLINASPAPDTLVVCDNGSTDKSLEIIRQEMTQKYGYRFTGGDPNRGEALNRQPAMVLICNHQNLGFAAGNNRGITYALENNHDFIWLLNSDTLISKDALNHLRICARQHSQTGIWGCSVVYNDAPGTLQTAGGCTYNPLTTVFKFVLNGVALPEAQKQSPHRFDYVYGASLFARKEVFEKTGLLNENYFLFYEESDFCRRAVQHGFSMGWCRSSVVRHKHGTGFRKMQSVDRSTARTVAYHENLSTLRFTADHYPYLLPLVLVIRFLGKACALFRRREPYLLLPLLSAYKDFFLKPEKPKQ